MSDPLGTFRGREARLALGSWFRGRRSVNLEIAPEIPAENPTGDDGGKALVVGPDPARGLRAKNA